MPAASEAGERDEILVVGGGVIGLSCALELARRGRSVRVVERGAIGSGSSSGNCGLITPSLALPIARPGMIRQIARWIGRRDAPLYVRPRLDLAFLTWGWQFARRCNASAARAAMRRRAALLHRSRAAFPEFFGLEEGACEWEERGTLLVFRDAADFDHYETDVALLREVDVEGERVERDDLLQEEPALREEVVGAWRFPSDAQLRPDRLMTRLLELARAAGVEIEEQVEVAGFDVSGERVEGVRLAGGRKVRPAAVVLATGAWAPRLGRALGLRLPVQPGKGYTITMRPPEPCPRRPMVFKESSVAATPWPSGFRLGGTMEFSGYSTTLDSRRLAAIREGARAYLRSVDAPGEVETWYGWRPMTPDGLPLVRRSPRHENLVLAVGHNMLGVSMAPATAFEVADLLAP